MSVSAIRRAVASRLRETMSLRAHECKPQGSPQPPNVAPIPDLFIAVHGGSASNGMPVDYGLEMSLRFSVTVSVRGKHIPLDRWDVAIGELSDDHERMELLCWMIAARVHQKDQILAVAEQDMGGGVQYHDPPRLVSIGESVPQPGSWWHSNANRDQISGLSARIDFAGPSMIVTELETFATWPEPQTA